MSKKGKRETPLITVEVPDPNEGVRHMIGAELVEQWFNDKLEFDTTAGDVTIIARDPSTGRITLKESYIATSWEAIQEFLDNIRHRLVESVADELLEYVRMHLATVEQQDWITPIDEPSLVISEEPRVLSEEDMVISWLRDTMGLERRARPSVSVSNIARSKLKRGTDPARKVIVREARALMKLWRSRD